MVLHIVGDSKSRRMRWTGHVLCIECIQDFDQKRARKRPEGDLNVKERIIL
jgi:hypothetical protein